MLTRTRRSTLSNSFSRIALALVLLGLFPLSSLAQQMSKSNVSYTRNTPNLNRRSIIEVDPVTLALNIEIPIADFGGRGAGLSAALHYNSKLWRVNSQGVYELPGSNPPGSGPP